MIGGERGAGEHGCSFPSSASATAASVGIGLVVVVSTSSVCVASASSGLSSSSVAVIVGWCLLMLLLVLLPSPGSSFFYCDVFPYFSPSYFTCWCSEFFADAELRSACILEGDHRSICCNGSPLHVGCLWCEG